MKKKTLMRELYEEIIKYDDLIEIPDSVLYSDHPSIKSLLKELETFNRVDKNSIKDLKRLFNNAMRLIAELIESTQKISYDHRLAIKKKQYVIDKLKEFIDSRDELDAEIPSDDDEEESSDDKDDKVKGLSKKELEIMRSIK